MELSEFLGTVEAVHGEAQRRGLFFLPTTDRQLRDRSVTVGDRELVSFASCSYLGLEHHPELVGAVHDAVERYGTQFSASRGYLSAPQYGPLEELLGELFGGHTLATASTSTGHLAALPVLATERDAIVLDHQVHHSVQSAATLARAGGARVEVVRHGELDRAEALVAGLARSHRTVWFACDGVYSMFGDLAPVRLLRRLLDAAPNVRLYVDDAHGMSWAGEHGRGSFLSRMPLTERVVVATSLNKAFSAAGGCLVFASAEERDRVRICGGPMVFSGPIQPPMLGAAVASARVHLSPEITARQRALADRVARCNTRLREAGLPLLSDSPSPIFFLGLGLPEVAFDVVERLLADGLYVCASVYPAVPLKRAGIRLTVTAAHRDDEIDRVVDALAAHVPDALARHGAAHAFDRAFGEALPPESRPKPHQPRVFVLAGVERGPEPHRTAVAHAESGLAKVRLEVASTIEAVDRAAWDRAMGTAGLCDWQTQRTLERVFRGHDRPEHDWGFRYLVARDPSGQVVLATVLTIALIKDDMLMRHRVSQAVEARRAADPYFLTSTAVMTGSLLSEGVHLYLDRGGPWREALDLALDHAAEVYEQAGAGVLLVRDLPADDPELDAVAFRHGMVKAPTLPTHAVAVPADPGAWRQGLGRRRRMHLRQAEARAASYERRVHAGEDLDPDALAHLYALYRNVAGKNLRLNVFPLPEELLAALLRCPSWEIVTLRLDPAAGGPLDGRPVAFFAAYRHAHVYAGFFCGLDYRYVVDHGAYRQVLYQALQRAQETGATELRLGMGADLEKERFGSTPSARCVYVQARDDYGGVVLREVVAEAGLCTP